MSELFRYAAFISYSSRDARFAQGLHRALESYGIPSSLGEFDVIGGGKKNRLYPVFRDREELSAGDLGERIETALRASAALIVVCSPDAAASPWVEKEIQFFASIGRQDKIFAIIADTSPLTDESGADATGACFPPAFRGDALASAGALEPLAADARKGKDGFRNAWLKLVAGLIGVTPGQLIDRDRRRRAVRGLQLGTATATIALIATIGFSLADALATRTSLATLASDLVNQSKSSEAASFALAAMAPRGAILSGSSADAERAVAGTGLRIRWAAQAPRGYVINHPFLEFGFDAAGAPTLIDLERDTAYEVAPDDRSRGYDISADRRFLMLRQAPGQLVLLDRQSGEQRALEGADVAAFDPAHNTLAVRASGRWRALNVESGAETPLGADVSNVGILHDGVWVLLLGEEGARALYSVADGARHDLEPGEVHFLAPAGGSGLLITDDGPDHVVVRTPDLTRRTRIEAPGNFRSAIPSDLRYMLSYPGRTGGASSRLTDLQSGRTIILPPHDRDWLVDETFSDDGRWLARVENGVGVLRDLQSGRSTALGAPERSFNAFVFVGGGRFLLTLSGGGPVRRGERFLPGRLRDLASGAITDLGNLPSSRPYELTGNGRYLVFAPRIISSEDAASPIMAIDLETRERRTLASPNEPWQHNYAASSTRAMIALADGRVIDVSTGETVVLDDDQAATQPGLTFSHSGRYLWVQSRGFLDLDTGVLAAVTGVNDVTFSPDDRFAVLSRGDLTGLYTAQSLYRFEDGMEVDLGRSPGFAGFDSADAPNPRWLITSGGNEALVRDLDAPLITESGSALRAGVCAASAQSLIPRPLAADADAETDARVRAMRGRPWNPCDWRGLAAILPDPAQGDTWFEGIRQWVRLVHVRVLGGADWACEQTTSGASARVRAARLSACRRFAMPATTPAP